MKIAVYAIAKDEARHVERFMLATTAADAVHVLDTGSTDNTVELLHRCGARVHHLPPVNFRFDRARNTALACVSDGADICVVLDLDETPRPGWREAIERVWSPGVIGAKALVVSPDVSFQSVRVHSRHGWRWHYPAHNLLKHEGTGSVVVSDMVIDHVPDRTKSRADRLPLLELGAKEEPNSPRAAFYLAREYMYREMGEEARDEFLRYLEMPSATWQIERAAAMRWVARLYKTSSVPLATRWLHCAVAESPGDREGWVDLAQLYHDAGNWEGGYFAALQALRITERPKHHCTESYAWGERAHDLASVCAWNMGLKERAREHVADAFSKAPNDKRIERNFDMMQGILHRVGR